MPAIPCLPDAASIRILDLLQENCEISNNDLATMIGISASPCWRRLNDMKTQGIIQRSVAIVDPLALGLAVNVFVHVSLTHQDRQSLEIFDNAVRNRPEVMECYLMSGESDYMLRVVAEDLIKFQELMIDFLTKIPVVSNIRSSFALSQVKYTTALPTGHLNR
ncbi:Lrp/AsnC family transcriptional regulator [Acetobacter fallax]|uniref:Lrp/AsnC family transcriptional regulator n=1 Tax=Acetobacter fallax TaxID=1737473 RepID=UPI001F54AE9D|nr:Lrp/AsnC family transcriptional regulator [Acetobacter fallax]